MIIPVNEAGHKEITKQINIFNLNKENIVIFRNHFYYLIKESCVASSYKCPFCDTETELFQLLYNHYRLKHKNTSMSIIQHESSTFSYNDYCKLCDVNRSNNTNYGNNRSFSSLGRQRGKSNVKNNNKIKSLLGHVFNHTHKLTFESREIEVQIIFIITGLENDLPVGKRRSKMYKAIAYDSIQFPMFL